MGAAGSIPADEAAAKEAGKTDDEIAIYKFCTGLADGSAKEQCAEGCEMGPPGAPPLPMDAMLGICAKMTVAFPDWKSLCLGITKNEDGTYSVLTQQVIGAMKADLPAIEGTPFPEVKLEELPDEAKIEMTLPVEGGAQINFRAPDFTGRLAHRWRSASTRWRAARSSRASTSARSRRTASRAPRRRRPRSWS
tara:strand:- start:183 stop:761 length:579 start_codon:yes stop_codon:yes gene_type:complete